MLKSLAGAMGHGDRLTARPGKVLLDRISGTEALDLEWGAEAHEAALDALADGPKSVEGGATAFALQGTVVLVRPCDPNRRLEELAADGVLSTIAARTLDAALELGRNVLVAGAWPEAWALMAAMTAGGKRPGAVLDPAVPAPSSWVGVSDPSQVSVLNPDRLCLWRTPPEYLADYAMTARALVGWVGSARLDRALIRYEVALERSEPRANAQMQVLAGLDLVVTVHRSADGPRVREIAELAMSDEGYRPRLLFATGAPPMQKTLIPVDLPGFVHELHGAGHGVLAEELEAAVGHIVGTRPPAQAPAPASPPPAAAPVPAPSPARSESGMSVFSRPLDSGELRDLREAPAPGWELDQLGDEELPDVQYEEGTIDDAALAATYGLAPPPRPKGVAGDNFDDILKKMRDGEMKDPEG
ncbi:MAG: hypothetical protein AAFY60_07470 [Myxococcota bacterium]